MAFNSLLNNMELIKRIYLNATGGHRFQPVTKGSYFFFFTHQNMFNFEPQDSEIIWSSNMSWDKDSIQDNISDTRM